MTRIIVQALLLMGVYLLVLTSADPVDALEGFALGLVLAFALRPRWVVRTPATPSPAGLVALLPVVGTTAMEMVRGTWRTVRFCLRGTGEPGFVELPRAGRSQHAVALWGVLTGEAPDEVPVDIDEERDVLIVHLVDASDPEAVRARHQRVWERSLHKVAS